MLVYSVRHDLEEAGQIARWRHRFSPYDGAPRPPRVAVAVHAGCASAAAVAPSPAAGLIVRAGLASAAAVAPPLAAGLTARAGLASAAAAVAPGPAVMVAAPRRARQCCRRRAIPGRNRAAVCVRLW